MENAEEGRETMRACGCHAGRPCTCEMGRRTTLATITDGSDFACSECVNCRLNARDGARARKRGAGMRRCLKRDEFLTELTFDRIALGPDCVFRMHKPNWKVEGKSAFYNKMRQMREAMAETCAISHATIHHQEQQRTKYSHDLVKAQDAAKQIEGMRKTTSSSTRTSKTVETCVDSDAFDSFSKQLIAAETLLPDLIARLEKIDTIITAEQRKNQIIRDYVQEFAVRKLQSSTREILRFRKWKNVWTSFEEDVRLPAVLKIQTTWRMFLAKKEKRILQKVNRDKVKTAAADKLVHFFRELFAAWRRQKNVPTTTPEGQVTFSLQQHKTIDGMFATFGRILLREAFGRWGKCPRKESARMHKDALASVVLIQRVYRGFRDRVYLKRMKMLNSLTDRVRSLVGQFIVSGNFWGFVLEIDADYRRFAHKMAEEERDATTFTVKVLQQRKIEEELMMQEWFTASALQNPLVKGMDRVTKTYKGAIDTIPCGNPTDGSLSQAILQSSVAKDLVALSPNKRKDELFPADLPPTIIRHALATGFGLNDVIAVMRGLQAQRKDITDMDLVLTTLQARAPLMRTSFSKWAPLEASNPASVSVGTTASPSKCPSRPSRKGRSRSTLDASKNHAAAYISENMLESMPGGLSAPIGRVLLVAALRSYDPMACGGGGRFMVPEGSTADPFQLYLRLEPSLLKIRHEQQAMEAVKPFLHTLIENRCYTAYDILYNVRGVGELVSWNIPKPLAKSIYSVIEQIREQSIHISKRNVIREVRVGADFELFFKTRQAELALARDNASIISQPEPVQASADLKLKPDPPSEVTLRQVRSRLEHDVLDLPLRDLSVSISDLLFQAAFLADINEEVSNRTTYEEFLRSLVSSQAAGDTEAMKHLVKHRTEQALRIADGHSEMCRLFDVTSASDLLKDNLVEVLLTDRALQQKVSELLEPFASTTPKRVEHPPVTHRDVLKKSIKTPNLSPRMKHEKAVIDPVRVDFLGTGLTRTATVSSQEQLPKS